MTPAPVAVIIRTRDSGRLLGASLQSIQRQTRRAAEIVVADEASTDLFTRQLLIQLEAGGQKIVRASESLESVRNNAIRATVSPKVLLAASGATFAPTCIESASALLDDQPGLAFVVCAADGDHRDGKPFDLIAALVARDMPLAVMFRRDAWQLAGGFDETVGALAERDLWLSMLARAGGAAVLPRSIAFPPRRRFEAQPSAAAEERFYLKHHALFREHATAVLLAKERRVAEQRDLQVELHNRRNALRSEVNALQSALDAVTSELRALGRQAVDFGDLRRTEPISPMWGLDRGMPLDRYYINQFLDRHRADVHGRVLEVKDAGYTRMFGSYRVTKSEVLDIDEHNQQATFVADLTQPDCFEEGAYDCFILTQVLGVIYDVRAALASAYRTLKPGGVLLCTMPAAGRISYEGPALDGDYWRFTEASIRRLFSEVFPLEAFEVTGFGNVLAASAFLYGLAPSELTQGELDKVDPFFPVVYAIRATKPLSSTTLSRSGVRRRVRDRSPAAILMYHRIADDPNGSELCVSPNHFRAQLQQLDDEGYTVLSLQNMARLARERQLPDRTVALTFDDGYRETLTVAAPILAERSWPFTVFIVADTLNGLQEFWWDTLERVFSSNEALGTLTIELPEGPCVLATDTHAARRLSCTRLASALLRLPQTDRCALLARVSAWAGNQQAPRASPMSAAELTELARCPGIEIGAHSASHPWLPAETRTHQHEEIVRSKAQLENAIGVRLSSFAYPHGGHDPAIVEMVRAAGFEQAVTAENRLLDGAVDVLLLPRIDMGKSNGGSLAERLRDYHQTGTGAAWHRTTSTDR